MSANILLVSDEIIKERTSVHGNTDPKLIYPDIKVAQDFYILPVIGTALFNKLQERIELNDWTGIYADYKILLDKYIIDAIIWHTLAELPTTLSYQLWNKGVVRKQGQDTDLPSMSELMTISDKYRTRGEMYCKKLILYLQHQSGVNNKFPEYLQPGNQIDTVLPESNSFFMPVLLDDDRKNPWCNPGGFTPKPYSE